MLSLLHANPSTSTLVLLLMALALACAFEFINGFHDTANSVATVIYTRSMRPWAAVLWSGICNFIGVFLGGISVAMGIVKLLPVDLLAGSHTTLSLITVFSMLISSCIWNLATWYYAIPASSSHALIGGILGVGLGNAIHNGLPATSGINWTKTGEVGLSLLISPVLGFGIAALCLYLLKRTVKTSTIHNPAPIGAKPPLGVRIALIGTSTGVSLAHGSNDGQKGVGLMMLILIAVLPAQFALSPDRTAGQLTQAKEAAFRIQTAMGTLQGNEGTNSLLINQAQASPSAQQTEHLSRAIEISKQLQADLSALGPDQDISPEKRMDIRSQIFQLESSLSKVEKSGLKINELKPYRKQLTSITEYAPFWVIMLIAVSLGLGTLVGWRRVVETIGEKIGTTQLTYAQGAVSQAVAMSMIGMTAVIGVPVSTTHCLSSGVAGSMVGAGSSIHPSTAKNIYLAWVLTLPVTIGLSCGLFLLLRHFIAA